MSGRRRRHWAQGRARCKDFPGRGADRLVMRHWSRQARTGWRRLEGKSWSRSLSQPCNKARGSLLALCRGRPLGGHSRAAGVTTNWRRTCAYERGTQIHTRPRGSTSGGAAMLCEMPRRRHRNSVWSHSVPDARRWSRCVVCYGGRASARALSAGGVEGQSAGGDGEPSGGYNAQWRPRRHNRQLRHTRYHERGSRRRRRRRTSWGMTCSLREGRRAREGGSAG